MICPTCGIEVKFEIYGHMPYASGLIGELCYRPTTLTYCEECEKCH